MRPYTRAPSGVVVDDFAADTTLAPPSQTMVVLYLRSFLAYQSMTSGGGSIHKPSSVPAIVDVLPMLFCMLPAAAAAAAAAPVAASVHGAGSAFAYLIPPPCKWGGCSYSGTSGESLLSDAIVCTDGSRAKLLNCGTRVALPVQWNPTTATYVLNRRPIFVHVDLQVLGRLRLLRLWLRRSQFLAYESGDKQGMCRTKEALAVLRGTYSVEL